MPMIKTRTFAFLAALALAFACGAASVVGISALRASADAPLEPSILNEVDHAISLASSAIERLEREKATLPRMTREEEALKLVSDQRGDGTWPGDELSATKANLARLLELRGEEP